MKRFYVPMATLAAAAALVLGGFAVSASASSSTQVAISVTGAPASGTTATPSGMWLWSQPTGNNYGNQGQGSLYFYGISAVTETVDISHVSVTGPSVSETLTGVNGPFSGLLCSVSATESSPGSGLMEFSCTFSHDGHSFTEASGTTKAESWVPAVVNIT
jgi:hypothetical protein